MQKNTNTYDLIVIGGGIFGTFHAYHALQKGLQVALFERHHRAQGASVRNFGQIVPSGMNAKWQRLGRRSLEIYKNIQAQFGITAQQNGSVYIASDEEEMTLLEELHTINKANDYLSQLLTAGDCLERYDGLQSSYCEGGLFFPEELTLDVRQAVAKIQQFLVEQHGLDFFTERPIVAVEPKNDKVKVVDNLGGKHKAAQVILCTGDDFKTLFPEHFAASELQVSKLQMMQTVPQPTQRIHGNILTGLTIRRYESFKECPSYEKIKATESADSPAKRWSVHILFKQSPDGSVVIGDSHEYADSSDQLSFDIEQEINRYILAEARRIFQLQDWTIQKDWIGIYAQSKTSDIFTKTIDGNMHIITGIGGKGMTGSPGFAEETIKRLT